MSDPYAGVKAVFLDVGGVFHLPNHHMIQDALHRAGVEVDAADLDRAHYAGVAALVDWPDEEHGIWRAYEEAYATAAGVPAHRLDDACAELDAAFATRGMWSRVVTEAVDALRALEQTGVALAIVSNSDGTLEKRLAAEGICQVGPGRGVPMAIVIDSGAVGVSKPNPAIFAIALKATGVAPGAAIHVGDAVGADVAGARAAGVRPVHLDPHAFCADTSHPHLRSLAELGPRLAESRRP